jgi:hypothetical protein
MMLAFDEAWDILKALREQQMFVPPYPRENAAEEFQIPYPHRADDPITIDHNPIIDESGATSYGTVHPAITSLLTRNTKSNALPNLNLHLGEKDQRTLDMMSNIPKARDEGGKVKISPRQGSKRTEYKYHPGQFYNEYDTKDSRAARSIARSPIENMEDYDNKVNYMRGEHFDYSRDASGRPIGYNHPAPYTNGERNKNAF